MEKPVSPRIYRDIATTQGIPGSPWNGFLTFDNRGISGVRRLKTPR